MMISTPTRGVGLGRKALVFLTGLALAGAGMLALAQNEAKAAGTSPTMEFNQGVFKLDPAFPGPDILPAPANLGDGGLPDWQDLYSGPFAGSCTAPTIQGNPNPTFPCGQNPAGATLSLDSWNPGTGAISADDDNGNIPILNPQTGQPIGQTVDFNKALQFPIMVLPSPTTGNPVPFSVAATTPIEGTYSWPEIADGTGALAFEAGLEVRILAGLGLDTPDPFTYCQVPLTGTGTNGALAFSSEGSETYPGQAYAFGLQGSGSVAADFSNQADATAVGPNALNPAITESCGLADLVTKGVGEIWLGNRADEVPVCKDNEEGVYPDCFVPAPDFDRVTVSPTSKTVKGGAKVTLRVTVRNNGTANGTATVKLKSNASGIAKVPGSIRIAVPEGESRSGNVTVTTVKKKKGKATITASVGSKSARSTITVKK